MKLSSAEESSSSTRQYKGGLRADSKPEAVDELIDADDNDKRENCSAANMNTRRRISNKTTPVVSTTQESIDGSRENAMWIASVARLKSITMMELSEMGRVFEWRKRLQPNGVTQLNKTNGWNVNYPSHVAAARRLRDKIRPRLLAVMLQSKVAHGHQQQKTNSRRESGEIRL